MKSFPVRADDGGFITVSSSSSPATSRHRPLPSKRSRAPSNPLTHPADEQKQRPPELPLSSHPPPSHPDDWYSAASYEEKHRPCDDLDAAALSDDLLTPSPPPSPPFQPECPLCMEPLDPTDLAFHPCPCSYQLCLYCYNHLCLHATPSCPACRREYDLTALTLPTPSTLLSLTPNPQRKRQRDRSKHRQSPHPTPTPLPTPNLSSVRIIQRNLVYVMGLQAGVAYEEVLKKKEWFGRFGKIVKASVTRRQGGGGGGGVGGGGGGGGGGESAVYSAYVTYKTAGSAAAAIAAMHGLVVQGSALRCTYGTTKYCAFFVRGAACTNTQCLYLHEVARAEDCTSKEELNADERLVVERHSTPPHPATPHAAAAAGAHHSNGLVAHSPASHHPPSLALAPASTAPSLSSPSSVPTISIFDFPLPSQPIPLLSATSSSSALPCPAPAPTRSTSEGWAAIAAGTASSTPPDPIPILSPSPATSSPFVPSLPSPPPTPTFTTPTWPAIPPSISAIALLTQALPAERVAPPVPSPAPARPPPGFDGLSPPLPTASEADVLSMLALTSLLSSPSTLPFSTPTLPRPALPAPLPVSNEAFDFTAFVEQLRATAELLPSLPSLVTPAPPLPPPRPIHQLQPLHTVTVKRTGLPPPPLSNSRAEPAVRPPPAAPAPARGTEDSGGERAPAENALEDDWMVQAEAAEGVDAAPPSLRSSGFDDSPPFTAWAALRHSLPVPSEVLPTPTPAPVVPASSPAPLPTPATAAVTVRAPAPTPPNGRRVGLQSLPSAASQVKAATLAPSAASPQAQPPTTVPHPLPAAPPSAVSATSAAFAKPILSLAPRAVNPLMHSAAPSPAPAVHRPAEPTPTPLPLSLVSIAAAHPPPSASPARPSGVRPISSLSHHPAKVSAAVHPHLTVRSVTALEQLGAGGTSGGSGRGERGRRSGAQR